MRRYIRPAAGLLLALALAAPASAHTQDRFTFDERLVETFSCGVTVTTTIHGDGMARLDADGSWIATTVRLRYTGVAVDPATGASVVLSARQVIAEAPGTATSRGQGLFIRLPGDGVVLLDVGRLVFDPSDGSTLFSSAHVIAFDDPTTIARVDAAICSLFD
jgi:hypothetical protein